MAVVQIETDELKLLIKESLAEALKEERTRLYDSIIPFVSKSEMENIEELYGENPPETEYVDATEWFEDEN